MKSSISKVLVTGGAGFIGSHLADRLLEEGFDLTVIDNLFKGQMQNVAHHRGNKRFHFVKGDIRNPSLVERTLKDIDVVFHEAGLVGIPASIKDPVLTNETNVSGTLNLLKASVDLHVRRFVYASSAAVYGEVTAPEKRETMALKPASPYGVSKLAAENYVGAFHENYDLETVSLRYFNVYGPRQSCDLQTQYGAVIMIFLNQLLKNKSPTICGDGEQTRDFIYVQDVVQANMLAMECKDAVGESFNVGSGTRTSINQVAEVLKDALNKRAIKNVYADPRPGDVKHVHANINKARKTLNFVPRFSFEQGIKDLVQWYAKDKRFST